MSIGFVVALSLAAAGCKKAGGDCDKAIAHSMEVAKASMPSDEKVMAKMRDLGVQHCKDDKWSAEVIQCMTDAKTEPDAQACYGKLSADQQSKMNKAAMEMMAPPGGGSSAAPAAAGSGSAADSSGSGSAGSAAGGSDMGSGSAAAGSAAAGSAGSADGSAAGSAGSAGSAAAPK